MIGPEAEGEAYYSREAAALQTNRLKNIGKSM